MGVIDTDPALLRESARAAVHVAEETWIHVEAEYAGDVPKLLETLTSEGPYGYTIIPQVRPDGSVVLPIETTREGIRKAYEFVRGASDLLSSEPLVEIRGTWYSFHEAFARGRLKGSDVAGGRETLALFPVSTNKGITGELVWARVPRSNLGSGPEPADASTDPITLRREIIALHDRYLGALRTADVEGVLDVMNDGVQAAVRDYVEDTGTLVSLDGKEAHRAHYRSLFEKYEVRGVDLLDRVAQDWYVFAELRLTVSPRSGGGAGDSLAFHTAEFFVPAKDGRFIARIGHGTDPAAAG
jgi:hypothetical protein